MITIIRRISGSSVEGALSLSLIRDSPAAIRDHHVQVNELRDVSRTRC